MNADLELHVFIVHAAMVKLFTRYTQKGRLTLEEKEQALKFMVEIGKSFLRKASNSIENECVNDVSRRIQK